MTPVGAYKHTTVQYRSQCLPLSAYSRVSAFQYGAIWRDMARYSAIYSDISRYASPRPLTFLPEIAVKVSLRLRRAAWDDTVAGVTARVTATPFMGAARETGCALPPPAITPSAGSQGSKWVAHEGCRPSILRGGAAAKNRNRARSPPSGAITTCRHTKVRSGLRVRGVTSTSSGRMARCTVLYLGE